MTKCKVNVDLRGLNFINEGTVVYANELLLRLMNYSDLEIRGTVPRKGIIHSCYNGTEYKRFTFPIAATHIPEWVISGKAIGIKYKLIKTVLKPFISTYNTWVGDNESDVFLFFLNGQAPNLPVNGNVVTCVHDITPFRVPWTFTSNFLEQYKQDFANLIDKSTKIITDSEFSKKDILDFTKMEKSKIDVVYCGVDEKHFRQPRAEQEKIRYRYGLPLKYILYFGTCGPRKNVESVVKAYACLPEPTRKEYALVITNPTEAVKACAVGNNVMPHYIENVSEEDKPAVYQMASIMVWLSIYEGFGLPIVEAQAAGTPVVCSNVTSLPEVAGDAAVLVDPMDTKATAAAIERCLYDEPFRQDLITKEHENVKRFSWDESARKLHDIILNL